MDEQYFTFASTTRRWCGHVQVHDEQRLHTAWFQFCYLKANSSRTVLFSMRVTLFESSHKHYFLFSYKQWSSSGRKVNLAPMGERISGTFGVFSQSLLLQIESLLFVLVTHTYWWMQGVRRESERKKETSRWQRRCTKLDGEKSLCWHEHTVSVRCIYPTIVD